jgi:hypothetical protein
MPKTKTPKTKPSISKSDFIRNQPNTMSAAEVVAKAKDAGMTIRPGLIYEVRRAAKAKRGVAKKVTKKATKPVQSKAAFVRANRSLSPQEIVAKAKTEGIKLDVGYVYNVRGADKAARKKKRAAAKSPTVSTVASTGSWSVSQHAETLLRAVAAEIGLGQAIELLHAERTRVHSLLRE